MAVMARGITSQAPRFSANGENDYTAVTDMQQLLLFYVPMELELYPCAERAARYHTFPDDGSQITDPHSLSMEVANVRRKCFSYA